MADPNPSDVLGALPRTRPHRRSDKRGARVAAEPTLSAEAPAAAAEEPAATAAAKPKAKPAVAAPKAKAATGTKPKPKPKPKPGTPRQPSRVAAQKATKPSPGPRHDVLGTAVQAAAELTEIGISATARALRSAVARLPRP